VSDVWVVEDEGSLLSGMIAILREHGLSVRGYSDPRQALADALASPPRLLITDHAMPELGGIELARALRSSLAASCPRVLLMTSSEVRRVDLTLFDHVVRKPFQFAELLAKVNAYLTPPSITRKSSYTRMRKVTGKKDAEGGGT
jgi:DNA-binding response OmpR family regulator